MIKTAIKILYILCVVVFFVSEIHAKSYYIKSDGNDSADGLSDATAWRSLNKVSNYAFQQGDDVYFKCGDIWKGQSLWVDWSGTSDNYATIGAYYIVKGGEVHGVYGNKPVFDGDHRVPVSTHPDPKDFAGMIQVEKQQFIIIENLVVVNSEGAGIKINRSKFVDVRETETKNIYRAGIIFNDSPESYNSAVGNIVENADMVWPEYASTHGLHWPAALVAIDSSNVLISQNKVFNNYGEGIGLFTLDANMQSSYNTVEDNIVFGNRAVQIYIANSHHNIIRRNVVYGTVDDSFHRFPGFVGPGLYVADESWSTAQSSDNQFFGNMVANCSAGIAIGVSKTGSVFKNSVFYNNTVIDSDQLVVIYGSSFENSYIQNNIFAFINRKSDVYKGPEITSGLIWDHNLWPEEVSGSRVSSTNVYGIPALKKMADWDAPVAGSISSKDFALTSEATNLINKGRDLGSRYKIAVSCLNSNFPTEISFVERPSNAWDIGADELSLAAPILSIR